MTPWLLVAGDFTPLGGMDAANYALARYLVEGLGWVACLVLACTGAATCILALASLQGR